MPDRNRLIEGPAFTSLVELFRLPIPTPVDGYRVERDIYQKQQSKRPNGLGNTDEHRNQRESTHTEEDQARFQNRVFCLFRLLGWKRFHRLNINGFQACLKLSQPLYLISFSFDLGATPPY